MKHCPQCNTNYADPTLSYCLDDGAPLIFGDAVEEPETAILQNGTIQGDTLFERHEKISTQQDIGSYSSYKRITFAGLLCLVAIFAIGVGAYMFYVRSSTASIHSIAVMPFANQTGQQNLEFLSDGMTESLISSLAQIPELK